MQPAERLHDVFLKHPLVFAPQPLWPLPTTMDRRCSVCAAITIGADADHDQDACTGGTQLLPQEGSAASICCNCARNTGYAGYYLIAGSCGSCQRRRDDEKAGQHYQARGLRDRACRHCGKRNEEHARGNWSTKRFCNAPREPGREPLMVVSTVSNN